MPKASYLAIAFAFVFGIDWDASTVELGDNKHCEKAKKGSQGKNIYIIFSGEASYYNITFISATIYTCPWLLLLILRAAMAVYSLTRRVRAAFYVVDAVCPQRILLLLYRCKNT